MKQTFLYTLSSFVIMIWLTACSSQVADKMAVVGNPSYSSDPCAAIDEKVIRLDRFTEVVQNTTAFHLEEKAAALTVPGITISNNKKQMLKDAKKKYAEYAEERQKYGCEPSPEKMNDKRSNSKSALLYDSCDTIDRQLVQLDEFTAMVNTTSAFHLEEKATALPVPGITVSNNKKQMLRDAKRKRKELLAERKKEGCKTPLPTRTAPMPEKKPVVDTPVSVAEPSAKSDTEMTKADALTATVDTTSALHKEEKAAVVAVPEITTNRDKEPITSDETRKDTVVETASKKEIDPTSIPAGTSQTVAKKAAADKPAFSSASCDDLDEELIQVYEFIIMVKNTSAFHLQEKAQAMPVPGITVSNNKKKMLRDAERKRAELLQERQALGCETE